MTSLRNKKPRQSPATQSVAVRNANSEQASTRIVDNCRSESTVSRSMSVRHQDQQQQAGDVGEARKQVRKSVYFIQLVPVSSLPCRRYLRSSFTLQLHRCTSRRTVCQQPAVACFLSQPPFSGTLPNDVQSAPSVSSFRRQLKTFLFHQSLPDILV